MMIPLEKRTNRLLSIHVRILSQAYSKYILQITASEGKSHFSNETDNTMLPKFELDKNNKEFTNYLLSTNEGNVKFILIKRNEDQDEKIEEFGVDLGDLIFFCNDLSKGRIKSYPLIIFEFTEGYYITNDFYINNTYNYHLEAFNKVDNFAFNRTPTFLSSTSGSNLDTLGANYYQESAINFLEYSESFKSGSFRDVKTTSKIKKQKNQKTKDNFFINNSFNSNKKEIKFSILNEKFKQYEFFEKQLKVLNLDKQEKLKGLDVKLQNTNDSLKKFYKKYEITINIDKMRNQIFALQEKIINFEVKIENIKKIISQKHSDLHISSSIFYINKENYKEKIQHIEKNIKKIEKYKIVYNSLRNKKLIEFASLFFSKICSKFYIGTSIINQNYDNLNKIVRYQFYEKFSKEIAIMMGTVANLINYLSKLFNIPLKYPVFINGSRSFIVKDKNE